MKKLLVFGHRFTVWHSIFIAIRYLNKSYPIRLRLGFHCQKSTNKTRRNFENLLTKIQFFTFSGGRPVRFGKTHRLWYSLLECKMSGNDISQKSSKKILFWFFKRWLAVLVLQFKSAVAMTSCMTNFRLFPWFKRNCIRFWLIFLAFHSFFTPFDKSWR